MQLKVMPPIGPMLSKSTESLPIGQFLYEPKWDGFRCLVFKDGPEVELSSRNSKILTPYFPELIEPIRAQLPNQCVLDGEIVIFDKKSLDFDALLQRIHPSPQRIENLAKTTPASYIIFDILSLQDEDLRQTPLLERRKKLESFSHSLTPPLHLTPATTDIEIAQKWFESIKSQGLEGIMAKDLQLKYLSDKRVMWKIKYQQSADCVVGGFRWHKSQKAIASLMLGVYDKKGVLNYLGSTSSFDLSQQKQLVDIVSPYRLSPSQYQSHPWLDKNSDGKKPGGISRWNKNKQTDWEPLVPKLVCEVNYSKLQNGRFRHSPSFKNWRSDKNPQSCDYEQFESS